jgi:hypothetical protein
MSLTLRALPLIVPVALVLACGSEMTAGGDDDPTTTFGERAGWPAEVRARTVGDGVVNQLPRLRTAEGGEVYALRREKPDWLSYDPREISSSISRYAADGTLLGAFDAGGDVLVDFVVHPGGEITTLALRSVHGENRYHIVLARRRAGGSTVFEHLLDDEVSEHDRQFYTVTESTIESQTLPPWIEDGHTVINGSLWLYFKADYRLSLLDGVLYMTAPVLGLRIYRLSDSLVPVWAQTVVPVSDGWLFASEPQIATDRDGTVWVTSGTDPETARVQELHFGTAISPRPTSAAALLSRFDATTGERREMVVVDTPLIVALRVEDGMATVVGRSRIRKFDRPNDTTEWDVFLAHASATGVLDHRVIDVMREDVAYAGAFLDDGRIAVVGTFDFLQGDTHSWIENGSGMVLLLDPGGTPLHVSALRGPRHVEVNACAVAGGTLYIGGQLDSYITHTCDGDRSGRDCHDRAFVGRWTP